MHELSKLKGRIEALQHASMFDKAAIAEAALDEALQVFKRFDERLNVMESRFHTVRERRA